MTTPNAFTPPPTGPGYDSSTTGYEAPPAEGYAAYPVATTTQPGYVQNGPSGKTRSPIAVFLLTLVTCGIYGLVWYYKINAELRNFSPSIQVNPGLAVLSLFVPVVGLVSMYNTGTRVQQAQAAAGLPASCSPIVGLLLGWIISGHTFYYQDALNTVWQHRQA